MVCFVFKETENWDAIAHIVAEGIRGIVDQEHIIQSSVRDNPHVFDSYSLFCSDAVVPVQSCCEVLSFRIDEVDDRVGIESVRRREDGHLIVLGYPLESLFKVWSEPDPCNDRFLTRKAQLHICIDMSIFTLFFSSHTMDESLV